MNLVNQDRLELGLGICLSGTVGDSDSLWSGTSKALSWKSSSLLLSRVTGPLEEDSVISGVGRQSSDYLMVQMPAQAVCQDMLLR